jgi:hypothetical protein
LIKTVVGARCGAEQALEKDSLSDNRRAPRENSERQWLTRYASSRRSARPTSRTRGSPRTRQADTKGAACGVAGASQKPMGPACGSSYRRCFVDSRASTASAAMERRSVDGSGTVFTVAGPIDGPTGSSLPGSPPPSLPPGPPPGCQPCGGPFPLPGNSLGGPLLPPGAAHTPAVARHRAPTVTRIAVLICHLEHPSRQIASGSTKRPFPIQGVPMPFEQRQRTWPRSALNACPGTTARRVRQEPCR